MADPIAIVEAAYSWDVEESAWLRGVAEAMLPSAGTSGGIMAVVYDARRVDWITLGTGAAIGVEPQVIQSMFTVPLEPGAESRSIVRLFRRHSVGTLRRVVAGQRTYQAHYGALLSDQGLSNMLCVNAHNPNFVGCLFVAPSQRPVSLAPRVAHRWRRIAAHVAAGFRVRAQLTQWGGLGSVGDSGPAEAVLRPDGAIEHAHGPAKAASKRELLRRAATALDRARSSGGRSNPDEALDLWQALIDGRWSLLDQFDSDGKRFLVAHRNDPGVSDIRGLSRRERQVFAYLALGRSNKVIAYELGLAPSTVATHVLRVRTKLGSRFGALVRAVRSSDVG